jgi:hypothetical protein
VSSVARVHIAGQASIPPVRDAALALDEMIYSVTSGALADAGLAVGDLDGVCMAASDLNDGRAISTMTLTGSTGSFRKPEMRLCNDSLSALLLGLAEIRCGAAEAMMVCSWNKLSDATPEAIRHLALEPVFARDLGYHPEAILGLIRSAASSAATITAGSDLVPHDTAVAFVVTGSPPTHRDRHTSVLGVGGSMAGYLRTRDSIMEPVVAATKDAMRGLDHSVEDVDAVVVSGLHQVADDAVAEALGVDLDRIVRQSDRWADLGYAAGMSGVEQASRFGGLSLVVSAGGIGLENAFAALVEVA